MKTKPDSSAKPETLSPQTNLLPEESVRLEQHFLRMHEDKAAWFVSDILDTGNSYGVLDINNRIIFGVGWHLTQEQCEEIVKRHHKGGCLDPDNGKIKSSGSGTESVAASTDDDRQKNSPFNDPIEEHESVTDNPVVPHDCLQEKEIEEIAEDLDVHLRVGDSLTTKEIIKHHLRRLISAGVVHPDMERLDWLEMQVVEVRHPLQWGSRITFTESPEENEGSYDIPSALRKSIDAAMSDTDKRE